ncbi:MAG: hypothetical protein ACOC0M_05870 [Halomonas sp.]
MAKAIRKHTTDVLVFAVAAIISAFWLTGFFVVLIAELAQKAWR